LRSAPVVSGQLGLDLAKFQQTPASSAAAIRNAGRVNVIYCRFSSELQRTDSNVDQERRCRDGLDRLGIAHGGFQVICDEAITGTSESRNGFEQVKELIYSSRPGMLVVSEQSRLSRGDNAKSLIKDIVYHGGRFISVAEGIDTTHKGWKTMVGLKEMHHAQSNEDTAERVRGAQEGRVLDGSGCAGDQPYGYTSEFADPAAAANYRGRGPKPKKVVVIDELRPRSFAMSSPGSSPANPSARSYASSRRSRTPFRGSAKAIGTTSTCGGS